MSTLTTTTQQSNQSLASRLKTQREPKLTKGDAEQSKHQPQIEHGAMMQKLPALLRGCGAAAILMALYSFLIEGWQTTSDLNLYLVLFAHTAGLTCIALVSGYYFKEGKGARLLMMLSLLAVPVNFSILGGFLLAATQPQLLVSYPELMKWSVDSATKAFGLTGLTLLVLIPSIIIGLRTLCRDMSNRLSIQFILGNLLLLIPIRDAWMVSALAGVLIVLTLFSHWRNTRQRIETKTLEGSFTLLLQYVPIAILLGRSLVLYAQEEVVFLAGALAIFVSLRQFALTMHNNALLRSLIEWLSPIIAYVAGVMSIELLDQITSFSNDVTIVLGWGIACALVYEISNRSGRHAKGFRILTAISLVAGFGFALVIEVNLAATTLILISTAAMAVYSFIQQQKSLFIAAILLLLIGFGLQGAEFIELMQLNYWLLALLGIMAIVFGSVLESKGHVIKNHFKALSKQYRHWSY